MLNQISGLVLIHCPMVLHIFMIAQDDDRYVKGYSLNFTLNILESPIT